MFLFLLCQTYEFYINIYEFHPDYMKYSVIAKYVKGNKFITIYSPDLWDTLDIQDFTISTGNPYEKPEILTSACDTILWRRNTYLKVHKVVRFPDPVDFITYSFKMSSTPFLHTKARIKPNIELHLGINMPPAKKSTLKKDICIVALPPGTKIIELFGHLPIDKISFNGWTLLLYERLNLKARVSAHCRFILSEDDTPELPLTKVASRLLNQD